MEGHKKTRRRKLFGIWMLLMGIRLNYYHIQTFYHLKYLLFAAATGLVSRVVRIVVVPC